MVITSDNLMRTWSYDSSSIQSIGLEVHKLDYVTFQDICPSVAENACCLMALNLAQILQENRSNFALFCFLACLAWSLQSQVLRINKLMQQLLFPSFSFSFFSPSSFFLFLCFEVIHYSLWFHLVVGCYYFAYDII